MYNCWIIFISSAHCNFIFCIEKLSFHLFFSFSYPPILILFIYSLVVFIFSLWNVLKTIIFQKGVVVLCGSSYKNIGVQKLLDAVVNILPSPETRKDLDIYNVFGDNLCASAFKVVHDKQKGPITFFRIYSGSMKKVNLSKHCIFSPSKLSEIQK